MSDQPIPLTIVGEQCCTLTTLKPVFNRIIDEKALTSLPARVFEGLGNVNEL